MKTITIGRSSQCDIILSSDSISRVHAEISVVNGQYMYYDRSSNGSNIGGQIICNKKIVIAGGTSILLANKIPLPWDRVYSLLPLSGHRVNEAGTQVQGGYPPQSVHGGSQQPAQYYSTNSEDKLEFYWGLLAVTIPIAGWIMYFRWKDKTPKRAQAAGVLGFLSFWWGLLLTL